MPPKRRTTAAAAQRSPSPSQPVSTGAPFAGNATPVRPEVLPNLRSRISGSYGGHGKAALAMDMNHSGQSADFATELGQEVASELSSLAVPEFQGPMTRSRTGSPSKLAASATQPPPAAARASTRATAASSPPKTRSRVTRRHVQNGTPGVSGRQETPATRTEERTLRDSVLALFVNSPPQDTHAAGAAPAGEDEEVTAASAPPPPGPLPAPMPASNSFVGLGSKLWKVTTTPPSLFWMLVLITLVYIMTTTIGCIIKGESPYGDPIDNKLACLASPMQVASLFASTVTFTIRSIFDPTAMSTAKMVKQYENRLVKLEKSEGGLEAGMEYIKKMIPTDLVVRKSSNNQLHLTDDFWHAIKDRVELDTDVSTDGNAWKKFWRNNDQDFTRVINIRVNEQIDWHVRAGDLMPSHKITTLLDIHTSRLRRELQRKFEDTYKYPELRDFAVKHAKMTVEAGLASSPASHVHLIATASLLASHRMSLTQVNYASSSLGASSDPFLTSPTSRVSPNFITRALEMVFLRAPNPPVTALMPWTEGGQCWCTAPSSADDPKAQLGIRLATDVFPTSFVLEHIPKSGTLEQRAAPKDFEIYVNVPDRDERARVRAALPPGVDAAPRPPPKQGWLAWLRSLGTLPRDVLVGANITSLPDTYVRVLSGTFDYLSDEWVQSFDILGNIDLRALGVSVKRVVVRVNSNWGSTHTCLYRARIGGSPLSPDEPAMREVIEQQSALEEMDADPDWDIALRKGPNLVINPPNVIR